MDCPLHWPQEHNELKVWNVYAGCQQAHGHYDARFRAIAEGLRDRPRLSVALEGRASTMATPDTTDPHDVVRDLVDQEVFGSRYREDQGGLVVESYLSSHARKNQ